MVSPSRPSLDTLRESARRAADADSLRSVASRVGRSTMGLVGFLNGGTPRRSSEEKLRKWYVEMLREKARSWADELLADLPDAKRGPALEELRGAVEEIFRKRGERPPDWVALLGAEPE